MKESATLTFPEMERAWKTRDDSYDGVFFFGVKTTGIFCSPSCPSRPKPEHLEYFRRVGDAVSAGYRPCKRCRPELANGTPPDWVAALLERASSSPDVRLRAADLRAMNVSPERARRWFQQHYGMTFSDWARGLRLSTAFTQLRNGEPLEDVILGVGYGSHSGFGEAFSRTFGQSPGQTHSGDPVRITLLDTPIGPMVAAASDTGVCLLEFADRRGLERSYADMRKRFGSPLVPGENRILAQLRTELAEYFRGERAQFATPVCLRGTPFQENVWRELQRIPSGETVSYETIAVRIGDRRAVRAVARANGMNRICILIPCHRVIAKDGTLSGYGGGVWRKRLLLEVECKAAMR